MKWKLPPQAQRYKRKVKLSSLHKPICSCTGDLVKRHSRTLSGITKYWLRRNIQIDDIIIGKIHEFATKSHKRISILPNEEPTETEEQVSGVLRVKVGVELGIQGLEQLNQQRQLKIKVNDGEQPKCCIRAERRGLVVRALGSWDMVSGFKALPRQSVFFCFHPFLPSLFLTLPTR